MRIEIYAERFGLNRRLYRYIRRKVLACIGEWQSRVRKVMVSLTDVALGSGNIEKRCRVEMELDGLPGVTCHQVDRDAFRAIDRSTAHMSWLLRRTLHSEQENSRLIIRETLPLYSLGELRQRLDPGIEG